MENKRPPMGDGIRDVHMFGLHNNRYRNIHIIISLYNPTYSVYLYHITLDIVWVIGSLAVS